MKKHLVIMALMIVLLVFGCKKESTDSTSTETNDSPENTTVSTDNEGASESIEELLGKLRGGTPSQKMQYFDGALKDMDGKTVRLADYVGEKVIFLNLWATWCPPCKAEMPSMEKLYQKYKDKGFEMIAVSQGEDTKTVTKFLSKHDYTFPIFTDPNNEIAKNYSTGSIPTTYLIDKEGNMLARFVGGRDWFSADAIKLLDALTAQ